ncbi:hypothetical protein F5984_25430 [Rudanella paleaurantiibacter]|uniref:Uncharacterized protein n=1 Tax=Rudanella paleaurantiibacter TaxID=2614655 RepID=A0A7J5TS15_9BACT|nr:MULTISPECIES: hypothetical protein [Rudanella]KAB7725834.1 hypothetical protein F5984_25430 [Rudanella paleaurantiibacter]
MAKNKRPFSTLLQDADAKKAVQEALHAPAQLPDQELAAPAAPAVQVEAIVTPPVNPVSEPEPKGKRTQHDDFVQLAVRRSIHPYLKMASNFYNIEIRELASEAIANDPRIKAMMEMMKK